MRADYDEIIDEPQLLDRIRYRYAAPIREIKQLGFDEFCFVRETTSASLLLPFMLLIIPPMWLRGDVIRYVPLSGIMTHHPVLTCAKHATYCFIISMGVRFSTLFLDGTALMTTCYGLDGSVERPDQQFYRYNLAASPAQGLKQHLDRIQDFEASGHQANNAFNFNDYAQICYRDDALTHSMDVPERKKSKLD